MMVPDKDNCTILSMVLCFSCSVGKMQFLKMLLTTYAEEVGVEWAGMPGLAQNVVIRFVDFFWLSVIQVSKRRSQLLS